MDSANDQALGVDTRCSHCLVCMARDRESKVKIQYFGYLETQRMMARPSAVGNQPPACQCSGYVHHMLQANTRLPPSDVTSQCLAVRRGETFIEHFVLCGIQVYGE